MAIAVPEAPELTTEQAPSAVALRCAPDKAWDVEAYTYFGAASSIIRKTAGIELNVRQLRTYVLVVESEDAAEVRLFDKETPLAEMCSVYGWRGRSAKGLAAQMSDAVVANRGLFCAGEQVKSVLNTLSLKLEGIAPAPVSTRAAFAHTIKKFDSAGYLRVTAVFLC